MKTYQGLYKHNGVIIPIKLCNNGKELSVEIEGRLFVGSEFTDLTYHGDLFDLDSSIFTLTDDGYSALCYCQIELFIPQVLSVENGNNKIVDLCLCTTIGAFDFEKSTITEEAIVLSLSLNEETYIGKGDTIEVAFDQLTMRLPKGETFVNCYGCLYGDYSVYGNSTFGTMLCFKHVKSEYQAVRGKDEYMDLCEDYSDKLEVVQEIHCCESFVMRGCGGAYR